MFYSETGLPASIFIKVHLYQQQLKQLLNYLTCLTWFLFCHKRYQCTLLVMKKIHQWKQVGPQAICYLFCIKGYHAIFLSFCFAWIAIIILNGLTWKLKYMYGCKRCYEYLRSLDSPGGHHRKHVCIVLFQDVYQRIKSAGSYKAWTTAMSWMKTLKSVVGYVVDK